MVLLGSLPFPGGRSTKAQTPPLVQFKSQVAFSKVGCIISGGVGGIDKTSEGGGVGGGIGTMVSKENSQEGPKNPCGHLHPG